MYESKIFKLREIPVFSLADASQIVSGKEYAKKLLRRLRKSGEIKRIKKDAYSFYDDAFLVSSFLVKPSYISSVSALSYYKLITQIPKDVFCFTLKKSRRIKFISDIYFIKTKYFFGFSEEEYLGFRILVATPEKAIIDSVGIVPFSVIEEAFEKIDLRRMLDYLRRIKKSEILKRIGYLLEKSNFKAEELIKRINRRYIYLDPLGKKSGKKIKKWWLIDNTL